MKYLPFYQNSKWQETIQLGENSYILSFHWNALNKYWIMSLYNTSEEPIVCGVKIVNNFNLLKHIVRAGLPDGDLLCQSVMNSFETIQRYDMASKSELVYWEAGELNAI